MFGFGKKEPEPSLHKSNPGITAVGKTAFANGVRSWVEEFNLVDLAAEALKAHGHPIDKKPTWLKHRESVFLILPRFVHANPLDNGGMYTVTTVQVNHPQLAPDGVFEYQHSTGNSLIESLSSGFDIWAQTDWVTLLDALRPTPEQCTMMEMSFPAKSGLPARVRRAVLGPTSHYMQAPPESDKARQEEHPFCACCLLTKSFEAFKELLENDGFYGLRLFAQRDAEGVVGADCRVNGEDWERGAEALRQYAATWPGAGYEFRKQYVVLQTVDKPS